MQNPPKNKSPFFKQLVSLLSSNIEADTIMAIELIDTQIHRGKVKNFLKSLEKHLNETRKGDFPVFMPEVSIFYDKDGKDREIDGDCREYYRSGTDIYITILILFTESHQRQIHIKKYQSMTSEQLNNNTPLFENIIKFMYGTEEDIVLAIELINTQIPEHEIDGFCRKIKEVLEKNHPGLGSPQISVFYTHSSKKKMAREFYKIGWDFTYLPEVNYEEASDTNKSLRIKGYDFRT